MILTGRWPVKGAWVAPASRSGSFVGRFPVLTSLNPLVDLFAVDRHVLGSAYPDPDLISLDAEDGHGNLVTDHQGFTDTSGENQHGLWPFRGPNRLERPGPGLGV